MLSEITATYLTLTQNHRWLINSQMVHFPNFNTHLTVEKKYCPLCEKNIDIYIYLL